MKFRLGIETARAGPTCLRSSSIFDLVLPPIDRRINPTKFQMKTIIRLYVLHKDIVKRIDEKEHSFGIQLSRKFIEIDFFRMFLFIDTFDVYLLF